MRWTSIGLALMLGACSSGAGSDDGSGDVVGDDDDVVGDDDDDVTFPAGERCEGPDPDVPVTLRFGEMDLIDVDGMKSIYHVPEDPKAVLIMFHGSGGDAGIVNYLEYWRLYNRMACNGVAILAGSSISSEWDIATPFDNNADAVRIEALWDAVDAEVGLPRDLPVFVGGFSNGGGFTPRFASMAAEKGWDVRAMALHNTLASYQLTVPSVFVSSENDDGTATREGMEARYQDALAQGLDAVHFEWDEIPTTAERLQVIEEIDAQEADIVVAELEAMGYIDANGERLFGIEGLEGVIRRYQNNSEFGGAERISKQLRVIWATHRFSGAFAYEEADFLLEYL